MDIDFLGTCHIHPRGERIVPAFLEHVRPAWVGVEADEEYAALIERRQDPAFFQSEVARLLTEHPGALAEVARWYLHTSGFEYRAAKHYCEEHHIPLHLIDTHRNEAVLSKELARRSREVLFRMPLEEVMLIGEQRMMPKPLSPAELNETMMREAGMEASLRSLRGRGAVIVGGHHLYGQYHNLVARFTGENCRSYEITDVEVAFDMGVSLAQLLQIEYRSDAKHFFDE